MCRSCVTAGGRGPVGSRRVYDPETRSTHPGSHRLTPPSTLRWGTLGPPARNSTTSICLTVFQTSWVSDRSPVRICTCVATVDVSTFSVTSLFEKTVERRTVYLVQTTGYEGRSQTGRVPWVSKDLGTIRRHGPLPTTHSGPVLLTPAKEDRRPVG